MSRKWIEWDPQPHAWGYIGRTLTFGPVAKLDRLAEEPVPVKRKPPNPVMRVMEKPTPIGPPKTEAEAIQRLFAHADRNRNA